MERQLEGNGGGGANGFLGGVGGAHRMVLRRSLMAVDWRARAGPLYKKRGGGGVVA